MEPNRERIAQKFETTALQGLARESLVEELASRLHKFDSFCASLGQLKCKEELWFHRSEFAVVNEVWMTKGVVGVYERWGRERRCDQPVQKTEGDAPILFSIFHFLPPVATEDAYFQCGQLAVPESLRMELLSALQSSGVLAKVMPERDSVREISLEGASSVDVGVRCERLGSENPYGSGRFLLFDVALKLTSGCPLTLRLRLSAEGVVERRLWDEGLYETGYEGHDARSFILSVEELRVLLPVVARVAELSSRAPEPLMCGMWVGNSLAL